MEMEMAKDPFLEARLYKTELMKNRFTVQFLSKSKKLLKTGWNHYARCRKTLRQTFVS
jgi:hypothetical protein